MPSKRILFVCNDADYFLAHRAHLAERMHATGWEVAVAAGGRIEAADGRFKRYSLPVLRERFSPTHDLSLVREIRGALRSFRPDAAHFITMKPALFGALALMTLPMRARPSRIVTTFPGLGRVFENESALGSLQRTLTALVLRRFFGRPNTYATFENESDRRVFVDRGIVPTERAILMAGAGLPLARFEEAPKGTHPFRVLWASRLIRGKGLGVFRQAAAIARARKADIEFAVAGYPDPGHPDNYSPSEVAEIGADPAITFLGHVQDMPKLLGEMNALCLPTRYQEGLPRVLIEAAASGLPSIASNREGCKRIVVHDETGIILDRLDGAALFTAVEQLAKDPERARRMGAAARRLVQSEGFDEKRVQEAFLDLYG